MTPPGGRTTPSIRERGGKGYLSPQQNHLFYRTLLFFSARNRITNITRTKGSVKITNRFLISDDCPRNRVIVRSILLRVLCNMYTYCETCRINIVQLAFFTRAVMNRFRKNSYDGRYIDRSGNLPYGIEDTTVFCLSVGFLSLIVFPMNNRGNILNIIGMVRSSLVRQGTYA